MFITPFAGKSFVILNAFFTGSGTVFACSVSNLAVNTRKRLPWYHYQKHEKKNPFVGAFAPGNAVGCGHIYMVFCVEQAGIEHRKSESNYD